MMYKRRYMVLRIVLPVILILSVNAFSETLTVSGDPKKGSEIFKNRGCSVCHSINRVGGKVGPDLTQVAARRKDEALVRWLNDPSSVLKGAAMPKIPWSSEQEVFDLIEFFKTLKLDIKKDFMGKVPQKEAGERLMAEYDCAACHRIKAIEEGRDRYPDLRLEGRKRDKKWLDRWLKDPQAVKPGTFMPTYPFTDEERAAVVEYLSTLR